MLEDEEVRPEGCICEPCSDISLNWKDIRTEFGYTTLYAIGFGTQNVIKLIFLIEVMESMIRGSR